LVHCRLLAIPITPHTSPSVMKSKSQSGNPPKPTDPMGQRSESGSYVTGFAIGIVGLTLLWAVAQHPRRMPPSHIPANTTAESMSDSVKVSFAPDGSRDARP
jgi:hypothetical protein